MRSFSRKEPVRAAYGGFTILELLVVMSILGILAAISVTNLVGGRNQKSLEAEARNLAGVIREAQGFALTGRQGNDPDQIPCSYEVRQSGAGYELVMRYHAQGSSSCNGTTKLGSYVINTSGITVGSFSTTFQVPFGSVSGTNTIVLSRGGMQHAVCVTGTGSVTDMAGSTCSN